MNKKTKLNNIFNNNLIIFCLIVCVLLMFIIQPNTYVTACLNGLNVWVLKLVPTLLPFMIITKLLISTGIPDKFGNFISPATRHIYHTSGASGYVFTLSTLSGYPMSAKLLSDLYKQGIISTQDARKISSFTSVTGPIFVIGTVGVGMFSNYKLGVCILISHIVGALLNGLIYRNSQQNICTAQITPKYNYDLSTIVYDSIQSILLIGGYITIFFMLITMLNDMGIIYVFARTLSKCTNIDISVCAALLNGTIEITKGCMDLSMCELSFDNSLILLTAIISFGGISTFAQSLAFTQSFGLSKKQYLVCKTTHAIFATMVAIIITLII